MRTLNKSLPMYHSFSTNAVTPLEKGKVIGEKSFGEIGSQTNTLFTKSAEVVDAYNVYRFIGTEEVIDRDGDVVVVDGVDVKEFANNPVVLWGHDMRKAAIGRVVQVVKDSSNKKIYFDIQFAPTEDGMKYEKLVKEGFIKAVSIGFMVNDYHWDEHAEVFSLDKINVFEISLCNVPANQNALLVENEKTMTEKTKQLNLTADDLKDLIKEVIEGMNEEVAEVTEPIVEEPEAPLEEPEEEIQGPSLEELVSTLTEAIQALKPQEVPVTEEPAQEDAEEENQQPESDSDENKDNESEGEDDTLEQPQSDGDETPEVESIDTEVYILNWAEDPTSNQ